MSALRTARICMDVDRAGFELARALGIELDTEAKDLLPEQSDWRRMPDEARLIALGEWLKSVCYSEAHKLATSPGTVFEPIGGAKYAHQND